MVVNKLLFLIGLFILLLPFLVDAFEIFIGGNQFLKPDRLRTTNVIKNKDLHITLAYDFYVEPEFFNYSNNITISFNPEERITNPPVTIVNVTICKGAISGSNFDRVYFQCSKQFDFNNVSKIEKYREYYIKDEVLIKDVYKTYQFTFYPIKQERWEEYVFFLEAIYNTSILEQGELNSIDLRFPKNKNINYADHFFVFPSEEAIPKIIPDDVRIRKQIYPANKGYKFRWVYDFSSLNDRIFWYENLEQKNKKERGLQTEFMVKGALLGLLLSIGMYLYIEKRKPSIHKNYFNQRIRTLINEVRRRRR